MDYIELSVVYGEDLRPTNKQLGTILQGSNLVYKLLIEIDEELTNHSYSVNFTRSDGTTTTIGYTPAKVDGTHFYLLLDNWVSGVKGLVTGSFTASDNASDKVVQYGNFTFNCLETVLATSYVDPSDLTIVAKVDKDLSGYDEVAAIVDDAFVFVDNDGIPEKMKVLTQGSESDLTLLTKGAIDTELAKKVDKSVVDIKYFAYVDGSYLLVTTPPLVGGIGTPSLGIQAQNTDNSVGWKELGIFTRTTEADITINSSTIFNQSYSFRVSRNTQASQIRISIYNSGSWGSVTVDTPSHLSGTFSTGVIPLICNSIPVGEQIELPSGETYNIKIEYYQTQNAPLTVDLVCIAGGLVSTSQFAITGTSITTELIQDNAVTDEKLADMPTMTLKGNDTGATATPKNLTLAEVLAFLSPLGTFTLPYNLNVGGNITQVGGSYITHAENLNTTKDFMILRESAVGALASGAYIGLIGKIPDGVNDSFFGFDGNGMARVGDLSYVEGVPQFTNTQALATREDSPVSTALAFWNNTAKRFDTSSNALFNGSTLTLRNNAVGDTPLVVNAILNTTANLQEWKKDGISLARVETDGGLKSVAIRNPVADNNSMVVVGSLGTVISRNIADANTALKVNLANASATGNILDLQSNSVTKASFTKDGYLGFGVSAVQPIHLFNANDVRLRLQSGRSWDLIAGNNTTSIYAPVNGFAIRDANAGANRLNIDANGNVGIGTIEPSELLEVNGNAKATKFISTQATGTSPLTILSTTLVSNLNANYLGGFSSADFGLVSARNYKELTIVNDAIADVPLTLNGIDGSTTNLFEAKLNGTLLASISSLGQGNFKALYTGVNTRIGGLSAGSDITTGENNIFIGTLSGNKTTEGGDNVAIGYGAYLNNFKGEGSVIIGRYASRYHTSFDGDILALGRYAGAYYGSGTDQLSQNRQSLYLGSYSRAKEDNTTNEISIGYNAIGNGSNTATIGNSSLTKLYAGSYEVERNIIITSGSQLSVSTWSADTTYDDYGYRASISITGVTSADQALVTFSVDDVNTANYAWFTNTDTNVVYIYSKVNTAITLLKIKVIKG